MKNSFFIDVHSHLKSESPDIIVIFNGLDYHSNFEVLEQADNRTTFCSMGIHPTVNFDERVIEQIKENKKKIIAVGEIGLDYLKCYLSTRHKDDMKREFKIMLELAEQIKKPVIVHSRMARMRVLEMVKELKVPVILHSFLGSRKEIDEALKSKCCVSISPSVFRHNEMKEIAEKFPIERIFCETDAPYIGKTNEEIKKVYGEVAKIRNISVEELQKQIIRNFERVFKVKITRGTS